MPNPNDNAPTERPPGLYLPNSFQCPNEVVDVLLPELSGSELKVLLYIVRRTFGFQKESDNISLSQMMYGIVKQDGTVLDRGVGIKDKKTLLAALRSLEDDKKLITSERRTSVERGNEPTTYRLNIINFSAQGKSPPPLEEKSHQGGGGKIPPSPRGENPPIQNPVEQNPVEQNVYNSNSRKAKSEKGRYVNQNAAGTSIGSTRPKAQVGERVQPISSAPTQKTFYEPEYENELNLEAEKQSSNHRNQGEKQNGGFVKIGTMLPSEPKPRRGRPTYDEDRRFFTDVMELVANELNDQANLKSTVTQLYNIFKKWQEVTGGERYAFLDLVDQARAITKEHSGQIKKTDGGKGMPAKNRAPYFFAVLRDVAGLREEERAGMQRAD